VLTLFPQYLLKKPDAVNFTKKNQIHPFEDDSSLEFFSQKNDASLLVVGTHSKKRPHNLVFARMFNHQIMDMMELGIEKATAMSQTKVRRFTIESDFKMRKLKLRLFLFFFVSGF
jgi:ribosome production factor 2